MNDVVTGLILVLAGVVAYGLQQGINARLEARRRRQATEIAYLERAYRALSVFYNRIHSSSEAAEDGTLRFDFDCLSDAEKERIELAVTDAKVYGSEGVIDAADRFCKMPSWNPWELMEAIRKDLRAKLRYPDDALDRDSYLGFARSGTSRDSNDLIDSDDSDDRVAAAPSPPVPPAVTALNTAQTRVIESRPGRL